MTRSVVVSNLSIATWGGGKPGRFTEVLVAALREGSLDPHACAWLADFFENGGAGDLKVAFTRSRAGNPRQRKSMNYGALWLFRMLTEECRGKEDAFARAKKELHIGKNRAEEYWQKIKEDKAKEAKDPCYAEGYLGWKEAMLQERADDARGFCDVDPLPIK